MVTLDDALQDSTQMCLMVWNAMTKKGFTKDPHAVVLKEMTDHLYFQQDNIEGMLLIEAVRHAAQ